jgi:hypothetical protein
MRVGEEIEGLLSRLGRHLARTSSRLSRLVSKNHRTLSVPCGESTPQQAICRRALAFQGPNLGMKGMTMSLLLFESNHHLPLRGGLLSLRTMAQATGIQVDPAILPLFANRVALRVQGERMEAEGDGLKSEDLLKIVTRIT